MQKLQNLKLINLYNNRISNFQPAYAVLARLPLLTDLDVDQNPFFTESARTELIRLSLTRLNDRLLSKS